jgi:probable rRNA maturation factor
VNKAAGPVRVTLQVAVEGIEDIPDEQEFARWVNSALQATDTDYECNTCVTIRLVSEDESQELNTGFRKQSRPTNVLAFPAGTLAVAELLEEETELGDLVVCYAVVAQEAIAQDKSLDAHFAHMTVHGTLHLVGYDHLQESEAVTMESLEAEILTAMGYADPY